MNIISFMQKGLTKLESEDCSLIGDVICIEGNYETNLAAPFVVSVADGVGGNPGGCDASHFIIEGLMGFKEYDEITVQKIRTFILQINADLVSKSRVMNGKEQMASTLSGLIFCERPFLFHIGNTRVYGIQGHYLKQLTIDHTTAHLLEMKGDFVGAALANKNEITACMGAGDQKLADCIQIIEIKQNYSGFIATSDGILDYVTIDDMERYICTEIVDFQKLHKVCELASTNGSSDDKTILYLRRS
jgi:protein phosphatase